jgi:hypothetical protein
MWCRRPAKEVMPGIFDGQLNIMMGGELDSRLNMLCCLGYN